MKGSVNEWDDNNMPGLWSMVGGSFLFALFVGIIDVAIIHTIMNVLGVFDNVAIYG